MAGLGGPGLGGVGGKKKSTTKSKGFGSKVKSALGGLKPGGGRISKPQKGGGVKSKLSTILEAGKDTEEVAQSNPYPYAANTLPFDADLDAQARKIFGDNYGKTSLKIDPSMGSAANIQSTLIDPFYKTDGQWDDKKINQSISNAVRRNLGGPTATIDDSYRDYLVKGVKDGSVNPLKINESIANSKRGANIFNLAKNNAGWVVPPTLQGDDIDAIVDKDFGGDFGKFALNEFHKNLPQFIDPATGDPTKKYLGLVEDAKRRASSGESPNTAYISQGVDNSPTGPASATAPGGTHEGLPEGTNPIDAPNFVPPTTAAQPPSIFAPPSTNTETPSTNTGTSSTNTGTSSTNTEQQTQFNQNTQPQQGWWNQFENADAFKKFLQGDQQKDTKWDDFMEFMTQLNQLGGFGGGGYGYPTMGYGGYNPGGVASANPYGNMMNYMNAFKNMRSGSTQNKLTSGSLNLG